MPMKPKILFLSTCVLCALAACVPSTNPTINGETASPAVNTVITNEHEQSAEISVKEITETIVTEKLTIGPAKVECQGFHLQQCLLVQRENEKNPTYFYDDIEGFEYEWGYRYEVVVSSYRNLTALADRPEYNYELINVISKTENDKSEPFDYIARYNRASINKFDETTYQLANRNYFVCDIELCASVDAIIDQEQSVVLRFQYSDEPAGPLRLVAVGCADSAKTFNESCLPI